jgi:5-methyltetrahydrofolate--homocysteine methyltransferase
MSSFIQRLSKIANTYVHAYPNAGLPNAMGGYDETAEEFSQHVKRYALDGLVNMVGGCCGTTPKFTAALKKAVAGIDRRSVPEPPNHYIPMMLSGMTEFILTQNIRFVNVGERCNISGSV